MTDPRDHLLRPLRLAMRELRAHELALLRAERLTRIAQEDIIRQIQRISEDEAMRLMAEMRRGRVVTADDATHESQKKKAKVCA